MMDWLGVASLWVGTLILALKSGDVPLPKGFPGWLASSWWALIPLPLVTVSVLILLVRTFSRSENAKADPQYVLAISGRPLMSFKTAVFLVFVPIFLFLAFTGVKSCTAYANRPPLSTPQPVLQGPVPAAELRALLRGGSDEVIETRVRQYIGQRMRVSGRVYSVRSERGYEVYIFTLTSPEASPQVYAMFSGKVSGLSYYNPQDHIEADCRIERLDKAGVGLSSCNLIGISVDATK